MKRLFNFCAGPAAMPTAVLQKAQEELLNYQDLGMSVMEMSHRSTHYIEIASRAEQHLRQLMNIGDDYTVLFLQGGASLQFAGVPLNLLSGTADYLETGAWSKKAYQEAKRYDMLGTVNLVASGQDGHYTDVPDVGTWQVNDQADYFHYCSNETIHGVQITCPPKLDVPLVVDMSSDILSRPINVNDFGMIYAGAQKNIGPAGLTLVIIQKSLLGRAAAICPSVMNYSTQAAADSMLNTPASYAWYLAGLVFEWLLAQGGVETIAKLNQQKATLLYQAIDNSDFYDNRVKKHCRSLMNVPFQLADSTLEPLFLEQAQQAGLLNLQGHRAVGGMRASLYNAIGLDAVQALVSFMADFEKRYG